jgi:hypothetical protein
VRREVWGGGDEVFEAVRLGRYVAEALEARASKTCLTTLVGGVVYAGEEAVSDTITSSAGETDGEEEFEDPESPRWA